MKNIFEVHKKKDSEIEGFEIEGTIKIYCANQISEMPFKSTYENGLMGSHTKKFVWKSDRFLQIDELGDVFVEIPETLLQMQEDYMSNYDLRLNSVHFKHSGIKNNYELKNENEKGDKQ